MHIKDPFIFTSFIAFLLAGRMMGCAAGGWCWFRPDARVEVVEAPVSLLQLILGVDRNPHPASFCCHHRGPQAVPPPNSAVLHP